LPGSAALFSFTGVTVFLGVIIVAEIPLSIRVESATSDASRQFETGSARPYRRIFPSYSHRDAAIVAQFERYARVLGDEYLRDAVHLRTGQVWTEELRRLIRSADIFQLFWSNSSMRSRYVREEWEYALSLQRSHFVRPTYWEHPFPAAPEEDLPPLALQRLHFQRLGAGGLDSAGVTPSEDISNRPSTTPLPCVPRMPAQPPVSRARRNRGWLAVLAVFLAVLVVGFFVASSFLTVSERHTHHIVIVGATPIPLATPPPSPAMASPTSSPTPDPSPSSSTSSTPAR
jgi:hypothetical protein